MSFVSYQEPFLDTDNELVRDILYSVPGTLARQERLKISERTRAGLERTRKNGTKPGRPGALIDELHGRAIELRREGLSYAEISAALNIPKGSVLYLIKLYKNGNANSRTKTG